MEDDFNSMKNEKEYLVSFLKLNTCDLISLQEKLEKKKNKYKNCKNERNNLKALSKLRNRSLKNSS